MHLSSRNDGTIAPAAMVAAAKALAKAEADLVVITKAEVVAAKNTQSDLQDHH